MFSTVRKCEACPSNSQFIEKPCYICTRDNYFYYTGLSCYLFLFYFCFQVISLTIAGQYNEPQEILLRSDETAAASTSGYTGQHSKKASPSFNMSASESCAEPSNVEATRKNIADYLSQQCGTSATATSSIMNAPGPSGQASAISSSSRAFKSPNVVAPSNETIPFPPSSNINTHTVSASATRTSGSSGNLGPRFPFASMTHAMTTMQNLSQQHVSSSTTSVNPPPYPGIVSASTSKISTTTSALGDPKLSFTSPHNPVFNNAKPMSEHNVEAKPNVVHSSPLLVNLLQTDADNAVSSLTPFQQSSKMLPPPPPDSSLSPPRRKRRSRKIKEKPDDLIGTITGIPVSKQTAQQTVDKNSAVQNSPAAPGLSVQCSSLNSAVSSSPIVVSTLQERSLVLSPVATNMNSSFLGVKAVSCASSQDAFALASSSSSDISSQIQSSSSVDSNVVEKVAEPNQPSDPFPQLSSKTQHLINPFTGQLEPMEVDDEEEAESNCPYILDDNFESGATEAALPIDSGDVKKLSRRAEQANAILSPVPSTAPVEKLKLKLKLDSKSVLKDIKSEEKKDKIESAQPYKVDVSFVSIPAGRSKGHQETVSLNQSCSEPRVPPLHISLKGRSATVVVKDSADKSSNSPDITPSVSNNASKFERAKSPRSLKVEGMNTLSSSLNKKTSKFDMSKKEKLKERKEQKVFSGGDFVSTVRKNCEHSWYGRGSVKVEMQPRDNVVMPELDSQILTNCAESSANKIVSDATSTSSVQNVDKESPLQLTCVSQKLRKASTCHEESIYSNDVRNSVDVAGKFLIFKAFSCFTLKLPTKFS